MATKKPRRGRKKKRPSYLKYLVVILLCFGAGALTYATLERFFNSDEKIIIKDEKFKKDSQEKLEKKSKAQSAKEPENNVVISEKQAQISVDLNTTQTIQILDKEDENLSKYGEGINLEEVIPAKIVVKQPSRFKKGKLAIIIDDMADSTHVAGLRSVGVKLTPSFFPPSKEFPDTPNLASKFEFYMIHLPLEAQNGDSKKMKTLKTKDSYEEIEKVVKSVRRNFPNAKFINNHTGSKFTSDLASSKMLMEILKKYEFAFMDSRTLATTKIPELAKREGFRYIYRDVFLDNVVEKNMIRKELQKAVDIANKRGYAIAIGHPKKLTFKTLKESKDILENVELVYVRDIYEYYR